MASPARRRFLLPAVIVPGLIVLAAALLRVSPAAEVFPFPEHPVRLASSDCEQHLGRVERVVEGLPLTVFDPNLDFPHGAICIWPPLFDEGAAIFVRVLRLAWPEARIAALAAWWPVLLGSLIPLATLLLAGSLLPRRHALAAALWSAGFPATLLYSQLGHLDHHVAEALLATLATGLVAHAMRRPSLSGALRPHLGFLAIAGGVMGLLIMTWQGGTFLAPVLVAALIVAHACRRERPAASEMAALLAPALLVTIVGTALTLRGEPPVPFTWVSISWFQPAFLALTWAGAATVAWPRRATGPPGMQRLVAVAGILAGLGALIMAGPSMLGGLSDAARYLTGGAETTTMQSGGALAYSQAWLSTIPESRPLAAWPGIIVDGPRLLTWPAMIAIPLAMLLWTRAALKGHAVDAMLVVVTGAHVVLALSQQRYTYYLAAVAGIAVCQVVRALVAATGHRPLILAGPLLAAALLLSAIPQWRHLPKTLQSPAGDAATFLLNVRDRVTPPPRDADGRAAWGVMCPWALGHTLRQWTKLPVAADNFGYGFEDQARTYLARSDDDALALLARRRCRYILTTQFESMLKGHAAALGLPPPDAESFGMRLHRGAVASQLFRPVVDSSSGDIVNGVFVPRLRLFEVVAKP